MKTKTVFGTTRNESDANRLLEALTRGGFPRSDISVLFNDPAASRGFAHERGTKAPEGALAGGGTGGAIGGAVGLLAGLGAIAVPGLGLLVAAGPVLAALSGAAVGAAVGSVAGGLVGLGIPEIQAKLYQDRLGKGEVLIAVHAEGDERIERAREIFDRNGASNVTEVSAAKHGDDVPEAPETAFWK